MAEKDVLRVNKYSCESTEYFFFQAEYIQME